jgi:hypothetical protein
MIRKLRADWVAKMSSSGAAAQPSSAAAPASAPASAATTGAAMTGPAMTGPAMTGPSMTGASAAPDQALWHDFHDKFLSYGGPPIPMVRKEMVGEAGTLL